MEVIWDPAVLEKIEPFFIGIGIITNVEVIKPAKNLDSIKEQVFQNIRNYYTLENIKETPVVKAYKKFYGQHLNIDPTKTRPSGEALARRILNNQDIPLINNCVYAINLVSIHTQLSFSGFDPNNARLPFKIRYAQPQEPFQGLGTRYKVLNGTELLIADTEKILCIYAYGDANATKITEKTKNIGLIAYGVPNISTDILTAGIETGLDYIQKTAGGEKGERRIIPSAHLEL